MPSRWTSVFIAWLAWCTAAYSSSRLGAGVLAWLSNPTAVGLAAAIGVWLAWSAWTTPRRDGSRRRWRGPRSWSTHHWAGVFGCAVWLVGLALDIAGGRITAWFGVYVVGALLTGFVPLHPLAATGALHPESHGSERDGRGACV